MESSAIDGQRPTPPQDLSEKIRGIKEKFRIVCYFYFGTIVALFMLTLGKGPLHGLHFRAGLVIGSLFPMMALLYYNRHYLYNLKSTKRALSRWMFPAIFIQIITTFGFMIVLQAPAKHGYMSQMFTGFYEYGKIFQSYNDVEKTLLNEDAVKKELLNRSQDPIGSEQDANFKIRQLVKFYLPFFDEKILGQTGAPEGGDTATASPEFRRLAKSINAIPFHIAFAFAFLGSLIFSLRDGIKRFNNVDMYPKVFVFYAVRYIVSCSLSAALAYIVFAKWIIALAPIVFFMIGYFPERVITYFDDKMSKYLGIRKAKYKPIPLSMVQGLSAEKALKLREIGIEDIQNLAVAKIDKLRDNLPFNRAMLCDWIAQCMLIIYFVDDIEKLRASGVRTIIDLQECALNSEDQECQACAEVVGIKTAKLQYARKILQLAHMKARLEEIRNCLSEEYRHRVQQGIPESS